MSIRALPPALLAGLALAGCAPAALVGGGALVGKTVFEERGTLTALEDADIALGVSNRLGNHSGELFRDVSVDVTEGAVVLTGTVPRAEHKIAATEAAWATPGVLAVEDALEIAPDGTPKDYFRDVGISNALRYALVADPGVRSINYTVTTVDRTVHVTGLARSEAELARVIEHARSIAGVRRVVSHALTIDDPRRVARIARSG